MGGGGGFAGSGGGGSLAEAEEDTPVKFDCWKPTLGKSARSVLLPKDTPEGEDICLESLQLLWLGRPNEATLRLSHTPSAASQHDAKEDSSVATADLPFPPVFSSAPCKSPAVETTTTEKANGIINFCAGPSLLKRMKPKKRVLLTSALLVSRALSRCGMEIPSMRILLQIADPAYEEEDEESSKSDSSPQPLGDEKYNHSIQPANTTSASNFDS